jgi:excisionase family DNA binding protein
MLVATDPTVTTSLVDAAANTEERALSTLTLQEAAAFLNVSESFLAKLLEAGTLSSRGSGRRRRLRYEDVASFREQRSEQRRAMLAAIAREAQEDGLYE